ncbi:MAG TPA: hypothetical protein VF837_00585 [Patescibacteria group bacterium]
MMENEQTEIKKEILGGLGRSMEVKILTGEEILKPAEVLMIKEAFTGKGIDLEKLAEKGTLNKQANGVLEAFGGDQRRMSELVAECVLAISNLQGGEVTNGKVPLVSRELLKEYVDEYLTRSREGNEYDFPLNANLSKRVNEPNFFDKYNESELDIQKVGYRVEAVVSVLNRLMYISGASEVDVAERVNSFYVVKSLHGLGNRVLRGYEKSGKEEDIKVNLGEYGEPDKRKLTRHIPVGGLAAIMKELV